MAAGKQTGLQERRILAENVRGLRRERNISQEALAEICDLHRTYIGAVERAERNVSLGTVATLAMALKVTVPELLTQRGRRHGKP
jgi:transcriptional regulator with XRE-family HTH domain